MPAAILMAGGMNPGDTRPDLRHVTLVAVSSIALDATLRAMRLSQTRASFGAALLLSDVRPDLTSEDGIEWQPIVPIRSRHDYSQFMVRELHRHIPTSHMLCVQWDGYVLNGAAWQRDWAGFDYIGAPWPHFGDGLTVGNGGFSYRSKRLMEACSQMIGAFDEAEDVLICRSLRPRLESEFGMRFAPANLARGFAFERYPRRGDEFGFHGTFNMGDLCDRREFLAIIQRLEPAVMADREVRELLLWAIRRGRPGLAWSLICRLVARMK